ncbi:GntR family transcriptional regulator [Flavobacterium piscis]|jgi:DNA-binding transcriptional MocR family regulator|uniref:GntR family transcriptional regulator n=1 Tax=Flavobacterium piscis TaxID=1114874 RepID=A0ABX2XHF7_9FLAO|nr:MULTISPECIES: PLP-dependent aminotransferase family protein [Flavobacterium]OCB73406.1 GntR family transcriptional regulator [Flavobacterium piscis]OXE98945.1 GntR family transcriptional regulator [Flavobacterium piscis]QDW21427.1 PLP-dependent aminotransferase family protein [Flavobacterium sp. KBS0721]
MAREVLYQKIANTIQEQIFSETLKIGDKLPSIRAFQKLHNVSMNTIKQAFLELESKSLIESRPKSGFYVSKTSNRKLLIPSMNKLKLSEQKTTSEDLITKVFDSLSDKGITRFSIGVPDPGLLPIAKLNKGLAKVVRNLAESGTSYEPVQGSANLRRNLAKWAIVLEGKLTEDDFVTTSGAMNAIFNCLMAVTKRGDTIAIESPVYFGIIQIAQNMGLNIIELPTHPTTGVDLEALKKVIHKVDVCCFMSNFSNPLGSLMPDENKQELVKMLTHHNIPLIEDDLYGNLFFGTVRPKPCKYYDEAGIVMWIGSVSKTLAPGYRVGWVAPGKFKDKIIRQKMAQTVCMPSLYQEVIADFLEHGRYDHHLRNLRSTLYTNSLHFQRTIEDHFPENTKISQPQGGSFLWLELDKSIDTAVLYDTAIQQKIGFAPGRIFTQHDQYHNCMRLNFGLEWKEKVEFDLKRLGQLVKNSL